MALLTLADRVAETTTTTGTGTLSLGGASGGAFRTFVAGAGGGNTVPYVVVHRTANEWEVGYGVVTAGSPDTLTRAGIYSSSNGGSAVNFSAGTKDVFLSLPAGKTVRFNDATGDVTLAANLGVGVTPSAWSTQSSIKAEQLDGGSLYVYGGDRVFLGQNVFIKNVGGLDKDRYVKTAPATSYRQYNGTHSWYTADSGTADTDITFTERARITAGGYLKASNDGSYVGATGAYHELYSTAANEVVLYANHANGTASQQFGILMRLAGDPNNTSNFFFQGIGTSTARVNIFSNGNITNQNGTYGTISDAKLKQDIIDAPSQWDDVKSIRFRKYRFISDVAAQGDDAPYLLGVVAQELQATSPGLVDAHPDTEQVEIEVAVEKTRPVLDDNGTDTGETETYTETETRTETRPTGTETLSVKSSILLMKAAVALQEAMARIEALEARLEAAGL